MLAVGNPFGVLNQTVTLGIVSATGRSLEGSMYEDFIQTDAAINQGNSGGALINARGELIGINTAIFSQTGGYQGVGFAVPSNLAKHVMNELITHGQVRRGDISGVDLYPMTARIAQELKAPNAKGVFVYDISARADAYAAGRAAVRHHRQLQRRRYRGPGALHAHAGGFPNRRDRHPGPPAQRAIALGESAGRADRARSQPAALEAAPFVQTVIAAWGPTPLHSRQQTPAILFPHPH